MEKYKIGVVGAGVMGTGVAHHFAKGGNSIILVDINDEKIEKAKQVLLQSIDFDNLMGRAAVEEVEIFRQIHFTTNLSALNDVDIVIENITENLDLKKSLYTELSKICNDKTIFAVNTSVFSITQIGSYTDRPGSVIGIHFMNPVPHKRYVEVIKGIHTEADTCQMINEFLGKNNICPIEINDNPGFVSNRPLMVFINEAIFVLESQTAEAHQIDQVFKGCIEHKMGPLETADMIGLDTILYSLEALYESYKDSKYRPAPYLKKLVFAGYLGIKSGRGFYNYSKF